MDIALEGAACISGWEGSNKAAARCPRCWGDREGMATEKMNIRGTRKVPYENVNTAPIVYFDQTSAHGALGGSIEVKLAVRALCPNQDATVDVKLITSGRLRCSPHGARHLIAALNAALEFARATISGRFSRGFKTELDKASRWPSRP
jgi:hypothetical protein